MTWDAWTLLVLGLAVLSMLRPVWAAMIMGRVPPARRRTQNFERAGGGAAMVTIAVYLAAEAKHAIGRGYWDLVVLAVRAPFMRLLPVVWVPALCWVLLVVLGLWFVYQGARASYGPRDSIVALWAINELAITGALIWWGVYVPDTWIQADLINFGLQGIYIGFVVGAGLRLLLAMRGPSSSRVRPDGSPVESKARHWLGRFRRY
jgi:hypothetical protein